MGYEAGYVFDAGQRMVFFGDGNKNLYGTLPPVVAVFTRLGAVVSSLEAAGVSRSSADSAGRSETRTKSTIFNALYKDLRSIAGTAAIIKKIVPEFENKFLLPRETMSFQETVERGRAFHADSAPPTVEALFTGYGLETDFRADLIADVDALAAATQSQQNAKIAGVGDTAEIDALLEELMDLRETLMRVMKNLLQNNPQKLAEWRTASHIEHKRAKPKPPTV